MIKLALASAVSVVAYGAMAALLLCRTGAIAGDGAFVHAATWVLFGYFALGILINAISRSLPERFLMTPITVVLAVATLVVAMADKAFSP